MSTSQDIFESINNQDELLDFLSKRAQNHMYYHHYTTIDSLKSILQHKTFLLSCCNSEINDSDESIFGDSDTAKKTYFISFAYGKNENLAMWGLYSIPASNAVQIKIPKKAMIDWYNNISGQIKSNNKIYTFDKSISDIVYYDDISNKDNAILTWNEGHLKCKKQLKRIINNPIFTGIVKSYGWAYEKEVRIKLTLSSEIKDNGRISLPITDELIKSMIFVTGPNNTTDLKESLKDVKMIDKSQFRNSVYKNKVHYRSLCDSLRIVIIVKTHNQ